MSLALKRSAARRELAWCAFAVGRGRTLVEEENDGGLGEPACEEVRKSEGERASEKAHRELDMDSNKPAASFMRLISESAQLASASRSCCEEKERTLVQGLVVLGNGDEEDEDVDVLKAVDPAKGVSSGREGEREDDDVPLLSLAPLSSDVEHDILQLQRERALAHEELGFRLSSPKRLHRSTSARGDERATNRRTSPT